MSDYSKQIYERLMAWFLQEGRHDLPWREGFLPYEVLVSEFMLQQTTVATIIPRFKEWMKLFPSIHALAHASENEVLSAWQGLGYYARARRLHAIAHFIVKEYQGEIPSDLNLLLKLPGIGPYTARALLAFGFNEPIEVLDTNIIRVIARLYNLTTPIDSKEGQMLLEKVAKEMLPPKNGRAFASALMDLGAMVCRASDPKCLICPLKELCQASEPASLPRKKPRIAITKRKEFRFFYRDKTHLYLEQSEGPHWKGLWILPESPLPPSQEDFITSLTYPITRYRVTMELYRASTPLSKKLTPFLPTELKQLAIPSPHRKALEKILKYDES